MTPSTRISVIISNFNGASYLPDLLTTLRAQRGVAVEIIVVDRNSTDESTAILADHQDVTVLKEPPESGLVAGYRVGAAHAGTDLLFFCNEDMWFGPECLRQLAARIDLAAGIAAADPWQWTYDGKTLIHAGTRFHPTRLDLNCPYPFRRHEFTAPLTAGAEIPFGCAGAVMIHRRVYESVGGWDDGFFLDYEDVDLFLRIWQLGWRCVTVPEAQIYHAVNASNAKSINGGRQSVSRRRYISGRSSLIVLGIKHFSFRAGLVPVFVWAGMLLRYLVTLRLIPVWWNLLAGAEAVRRLPAALRHRRRWSRERMTRPGELFFRAPDFQGSSARDPDDPALAGS